MGKKKINISIKKSPEKKAAKAEKKAAPAKNKGVFKKVGKIGAAVLTGGVSLLADKKAKGKIKAAVKNPKLKTAVKKVGKIGAAVATGGVSLLADKKVRGKVKAGAKKVGGKAVKALKQVAGKMKEGAEFAALLPFMPPMLIALKAKGVKVPKGSKPKEVASLFYVNVVKKQHLEHCEHLDGGLSGEVALGVAKNLYENSSHNVVGVAVTAGVGIVKAILDFFAAKKKQQLAAAELKEKGEVSPENELTPEEEAAISDSPGEEPEDKAMVSEFTKSEEILEQEMESEEENSEVEDVEKSKAVEKNQKKLFGENTLKNTKAPKETAKKETAAPASDKGRVYGVRSFFSHNRV